MGAECVQCCLAMGRQHGIHAVLHCGGAAMRAVVLCCLAMGRQGGQLGRMPTISHQPEPWRAGLAHKVWLKWSGPEGLAHRKA